MRPQDTQMASGRDPDEGRITIPPEAVEAAARAMWRTDDPSQWEKGMAIAAIAAAIRAWPGAYHSKGYNTYFENYFDHVVIPLPQEPEA